MSARLFSRLVGGISSRAAVRLGLGVVVAVSSTMAGCAAGASTDTGPPAPGSSSARPTATRGAPATVSPRTALAGTWQPIPEPPVKADYAAFVDVWTGTELIVFSAVTRDGPDGPIVSGAGAVYNPARNTWRKLRPFPHRAYSIEGGIRAVWTGTEMLLWGQANGAYDPATDRWRPLRSPKVGAASSTLWTGREVIMWGGGCCDDASAEGAVYDIAHDTWQRMPPSPLAGRHSRAVWTGTEMIVVGGIGRDATVLTDAAAYNPSTATWRRLPTLPAARARGSVTWTGSDVVIAGGIGSFQSPPYADALAYSPITNRWRALAAMPNNRHSHCAVWTGGQLLVFGGQTAQPGDRPSASVPQHRGWSYEPNQDRWFELPPAPASAHEATDCVWTGAEMIVISSNGGAIYTAK